MRDECVTSAKWMVMKEDEVDMHLNSWQGVKWTVCT